jgi:P-type Ca2+ transporter type 2C
LTFSTRRLWRHFHFPAAILFPGLALYVPFLASIFKFGQLHLVDLAICALASVMSILWFEVLKIINRRVGKRTGRETHV